MTLVDSTVDSPGFWLSVSDLAKAKGISKQAVSKRLERFAGSVTTRPGPRGSLLVNAAEFDKAAGDIGDTLRASAAPAAVEPQEATKPTDSAILTAERARREGYAAEIARLDLEQRLGNLVPVADVTAAAMECAESFVRRVEQISARADDMAAAVAKDGVAGARALFKAIVFELRDAIARDMTSLSTETPLGREGIDDAGDAPDRLP